MFNGVLYFPPKPLCKSAPGQIYFEYMEQNFIFSLLQKITCGILHSQHKKAECVHHWHHTSKNRHGQVDLQILPLLEKFVTKWLGNINTNLWCQEKKPPCAWYKNVAYCADCKHCTHYHLILPKTKAYVSWESSNCTQSILVKPGAAAIVKVGK